RARLRSLPTSFAACLFLAVCADSAHAAPVPYLAGQWGRDMLFFEPPASGPGPVMLAKRRPGGALVPQTTCCDIVQSWFGDPGNPILNAPAAAAVRKNAELSLQGTVLPDLHSTCWPEPPPYVLGLHYGVLIVQQQNEVKLFYLLYNTVRRIRLNASHPKNLKPSWTGD